LSIRGHRGVLEHWDQILTARLHGLGWPGEAFVELLLAAIAGGVVGLEREVRGRQAGFRTNILVAVGSALVMIVSSRVAFHDWPRTPDSRVNVNVDPARIAYSVMTGIGFLGAGIIVQYRGGVRGLTTAAGIWCVAAIGLAAGLGLYLLTVFGTLLVVAALWLLDWFEDRLPKARYRNVVLRRPWVDGCVADTVKRLEDAEIHVVDVSYRRSEDLRTVDIDARVAYFNSKATWDLDARVGQDGVVDVISMGEG
jgi:putative Mg2+ transporter-C (MgtC) family protein